jgi:hypothetical protein
LITCALRSSGTSVFFSYFFGTFSSSEDEALLFSNSSEEEESLCFNFRLDPTGSALSETFFAESIGLNGFFLAICHLKARGGGQHNAAGISSKA